MTVKNFEDDILHEAIKAEEEWNYSVKAHMEFDRFIEAVEENEGKLISECQNIFKWIDEVVLGKEQAQFERQIMKETTLFRARIINPKDYSNENSGLARTLEGKLIGYNELNSREPILGIAGEGRNSIEGSSYLYAANNPQTACVEIKSQFGELISLATLKTKRELNVIDFSSEKAFQYEDTKKYKMRLGKFFTQLMLRYSQPVQGKNSYRATQIISDYIRKTGIDGIMYKSFLSPGGVNYTIFNCHPRNIKVIESKVLIHKYANHSYWDFNENKEVLSNAEGKWMRYEEKIAKTHRDHINTVFKIHQEKDNAEAGNFDRGSNDY